MRTKGRRKSEGADVHRLRRTTSCEKKLEKETARSLIAYAVSFFTFSLFGERGFFSFRFRGRFRSVQNAAVLDSVKALVKDRRFEKAPESERKKAPALIRE